MSNDTADKRRAIDECAQAEMEQAQRQGRSLSFEEARRGWVKNQEKMDRQDAERRRKP